MKRKKLIFTFILLLFFVSLNSGTSATNPTEVTAGTTIETPQPIFSVADAEGPIIGTPSLDDPNPDSDEDVQVTVPINDVDGVKNATLFWRYKSINDTYFNNTVFGTSTDTILDVTDYNFDDYGDITGIGDVTPQPTGWRYGDFLYNMSIVSNIDMIIRGPGFFTNLTYVRIEARNITTGIWKTVFEKGSYGSKLDLGDVSYQDSNNTLGYKVRAVTYRTPTEPSDPIFLTLTIEVEKCDWVIPAANEDTFVDYYIETFDEWNQSTKSPTYTFLMDFAPDVTIEDPVQAWPRIAFKADEEISVIVSVEDDDGVDTINKSSGILYYKFTSEINWSKTNLNYFSGTTVYFFNTTIPASNLRNVEATLELQANVSDIIKDNAGIMEDKKGREGSSSLTRVDIDSMAPRVIEIDIDNYQGLQNITLSSIPINIDITVNDTRGTSSVAIYYSLPNGTTFKRLEMVNTSLIGSGIEISTFNTTIPASNETAFVEYFFETEDFLGNKGNTSFINLYYSDATAPSLDILSIYPTYISNYTNVLIIFNSTDYSGLYPPVVWFSLDNKTSWVPLGATEINYQDQALIDYQERFTATDLHFIENNAISSYPLEIIRNGPVDIATLSFEITHELPTDLRIWLKLDDGRSFLLFDRESGPNTILRDIDLISLGITESDFNKGNFTLEIQDFSDLYSGTITKYEVEIIHHTVPLGYQYMVTIPASINDTTVFFYINMTDSLWNSENTTTFEYYSDGLAPSVNIVSHTSIVNLGGGDSIPIYAMIEDQGGILGADAYYKFSEGDEWMVGAMSLNSTLGSYSFDVPVPSASGIMYYKVRAFDFSGLSNETAIFNVTYSNGLAPCIEILGIPYPVPLDMNGTNTIRVWANVTDLDGTITNCTIGYQFDSGEFINKEMVFDNKTGIYYLDIEVTQRSGNLTFIIYARDNSDLTSESDPYTIEFENAGTSPGLPTDLILFGAVLAVGGGGSVATAVYLYRKGKLRLPGRGD